jgi:hypothetical protein
MIASLIGPSAAQGNQGVQGLWGFSTADKVRGFAGFQGLQSPYTGFQGLPGPGPGSVAPDGFQGWYGFAGPGANGVGAGSISVPFVLNDTAGYYLVSNTITLSSPAAAVYVNGFSSSNSGPHAYFKTALTGSYVTPIGIAPSPSWTAYIGYYQGVAYLGPGNNVYSTPDTSGWVEVDGSNINMYGVDGSAHYFPEDVYVYGPAYPVTGEYSMDVSWIVQNSSDPVVGYVTIVPYLPGITTVDVTPSGGTLGYGFSTLPANTPYFMFTINTGLQSQGVDVLFTITVSQQANQGNTNGYSSNQSYTVNYLTM